MVDAALCPAVDHGVSLAPGGSGEADHSWRCVEQLNELTIHLVHLREVLTASHDCQHVGELLLFRPANPYRNSISIAAILLMAISAVVIYSNPIGLPTTLFTLALCASAATLGLNIKDNLKGHFNRPATSSVSDLDDDSSSAVIDPMVTAALTTPPETLIQSKLSTETDIPTTNDTQQKHEENLTPRHRQG